MKEIIKQFLDKPSIIIEAGAHIGRDTIKMAKIWPNANIYAFEPVPGNYLKLVNNTHNFTNVKCYNFALADIDSESDMYVGQDAASALSSLYKPTEELNFHYPVKFEKQKVKTMKLDSWAKENNITYIDFMWLDMQGSELPMLKASINMTQKTKLILAEANLIERYENISLYNDILAWFEKNNFQKIAQSEIKNHKVNILFKNKLL